MLLSRADYFFECTANDSSHIKQIFKTIESLMTHPHNIPALTPSSSNTTLTLNTPTHSHISSNYLKLNALHITTDQSFIQLSNNVKVPVKSVERRKSLRDAWQNTSVDLVDCTTQTDEIEVPQIQFVRNIPREEVSHSHGTISSNQSYVQPKSLRFDNVENERRFVEDLSIVTSSSGKKGGFWRRLLRI